MALRGQAPAIAEEATIPCKEAREALIYSIVGFFCCAIIIEPIAISKALKAKKMIEMNPQLSGSGQATAALIISIIGIVLFVLGLLVRIAGLAAGGGSNH